MGKCVLCVQGVISVCLYSKRKIKFEIMPSTMYFGICKVNDRGMYSSKKCSSMLE